MTLLWKTSFFLMLLIVYLASQTVYVNAQWLSPPLVQWRSGTSESIIMCNGGFVKIIKTEDHSPACVKIETAEKLIDRGWATWALSSISVLTNQEKNGTLSGGVSVSGGPCCVPPSISNPNANYEVDVYATDGVTIVGKTLADANAHYSIQLPAGNYIIYTYEIPKQAHLVPVFAGKNTIFNISYNNGVT